MIETGRVLQQRYRIDKQIGQGGMGAVYVATDERFGSTVAIKETLCMDANFRKAIEREARLLNSLKHSALPRVSDHFLEDAGQFLVMEFIPGEDLSFILERDQTPFPIETVLNWADQLLDALDFLHNQDIPVIHRDIKPQNLKVTLRGQIILLDFGLAKGNPTDAGHQTAAKSIFGYSRNYASLEQIQGTGTDPRSDLYSLAATLYHLLTCVPPEDALSRAMSVLSQREDPLTPANVLRPALPRGIAGILQKAMDLNADARPDSAADMRQMFRESDKYSHHADAVTVSSQLADPQMLAQKTKLMADETRAVEINQTDLKTEVFMADLSELTSAHREGSAAGPAILMGSTSASAALPARRRRGKVFAAAAFGLLLAGGLAAAGLYVINPTVFGIVPVTEKSADQVKVPAVPVDENAADLNTNSDPHLAESTAAAANADSGVQMSGDNEKALSPIGKTIETSKTGKASGTDRRRTDSAVGDIPKDALPGEVTVNEPGDNGPVTTRVYPNGRPQVNPPRPVNPMNPFPRGINPRNLTPQQRRRLQTMMRNGQRPPAYPPVQ